MNPKRDLVTIYVDVTASVAKLLCAADRANVHRHVRANPDAAIYQDVDIPERVVRRLEALAARTGEDVRSLIGAELRRRRAAQGGIRPVK